MGTGVISPGYSGRGVSLIAHLHLVRNVEKTRVICLHVVNMDNTKALFYVLVALLIRVDVNQRDENQN
jgi:hypothetical protein